MAKRKAADHIAATKIMTRSQLMDLKKSAVHTFCRREFVAASAPWLADRGSFGRLPIMRVIMNRADRLRSHQRPRARQGAFYTNCLA